MTASPERQVQDIQFKSLTDNIDTSTTSGRFFFHVMASLAQLERELALERTNASMAAARPQTLYPWVPAGQCK